MSLNPNSGMPRWNYTDPEKPNFCVPAADGSQVLIGTVVAAQEVQAIKFRSNPPVGDTWPDGNPKMSIRIALAQPDGSLTTFTFAKAGAKAKKGEKRSIHMDLFRVAGGVDFMNLIGKTIQLTTWPANPQNGQTWGQGNPRLFDVKEIQAGPFMLTQSMPSELTVPELYFNDSAQGGRVMQHQAQAQPQAAPMYQMPQQPMAGVQPSGMYPAPQAVTRPLGEPATASQPYQPVASAPDSITVPTMPVMQQPMTAATPAGMDPAVAAAMQAVGAVNVQPVEQSASLYDEDIPF